MPQNALKSQPDPGPMIDEKVLRGLTRLPVLPLVWRKVLDCLEDPWSTLGELEAIIRREQALAARLLAEANSAFYGLSGEVTSVQRAVQVLGLQTVRRVCMDFGLSQLLRASNPYRRAEGQILWRHCVQVAEAAGLLAGAARGLEAETAYTAGLLHDLGKVLLAACFPLAFQAVRQKQQREKISWLAAEEALKLDHQALGLFLAQKWGLPPLLAEVIGQHHDPRPGPGQDALVSLAHLADGLARSLLVEPPEQAAPSQAQEACLAALGLDAARLEACREKLRARLEAMDKV